MQSILFTFIIFFILVTSSCLKNSKNADLIVSGTVMTMDAGKNIIQDGVLVIKGEDIIETGGEELLKKYRSKKYLGGEDNLILPGLVNSHTHAAMVIFRGISEDKVLSEWITKDIYPLENQFITPDNVKLGSELAIAEMIRSGTTTFNDMYFFESEVAKVVKKIGIRAVLGESLSDHRLGKKMTTETLLALNEQLINEYKGDPLITINISPHAVMTCSSDLLKAAKKQADKYNLLFYTHLGETKNEFFYIKDKFGLSPVEYYNSLGLLDENTTIAHAVHLSGTDIRILSEKKTAVVHNPESNLKLLDGIAPLPSYFKTGLKVGLGTDGAASNNNLNLFEEMHTAALIHKIKNNNPDAVKAEKLLEAATIGGAKALRLDKKIGSLEKGKKADLILIDISSPEATPVYDYYTLLVYSLQANAVESVIINGKIVMENRKIRNLEEKEVISKVKKLSLKIKEYYLKR